MAIRIGCGSWGDDAYKELLFPPGTPSRDRLAWYAKKFDHVEVNSSYYATPRREAAAAWAKQTPPEFLFDIKLHRAFSQSPQKTATEGKLVKLLLEGVAPLIRVRKLGAFLLVLDPRFDPDRHSLEELDPLIEALRPHPLAVEVRHRGWVTGSRRGATFRFYRERKIAWVAVDMPRHPTLLPPLYEVTDPGLAYLRLHGRNPRYQEAKSAAERHTFLYSKTQLQALARKIRELAGRAKEVRVVANNHALDYAPRTAMAIRETVGSR
jgi:uncharacterized protein YecE (DUF72 family)